MLFQAALFVVTFIENNKKKKENESEIVEIRSTYCPNGSLSNGKQDSS